MVNPAPVQAWTGQVPLGYRTRAGQDQAKPGEQARRAVAAQVPKPPPDSLLGTDFPFSAGARRPYPSESVPAQLLQDRGDMQGRVFLAVLISTCGGLTCVYEVEIGVAVLQSPYCLC